MKVGARPILVSLAILAALALRPRNAAAQVSYAYDPGGRLCAAAAPPGTYPSVTAYQYDEDGNLLGIATNPGPGAIQFSMVQTSGPPQGQTCPSTCNPQTCVTLCGIGFGSTPGTNAVSFIDSNNNSTSAKVCSASPTQLMILVPGVSNGNYTIGETGAGGGAFSIGYFNVN